MTPQEALSVALRKLPVSWFNGAKDGGIISIPRLASAILAALPQGWGLYKVKHAKAADDAWERYYMEKGAQQERERLRARYEDARSDAAGPYVFEPTDVVAVGVMDAVVRSLLAEPEDEA